MDFTWQQLKALNLEGRSFITWSRTGKARAIEFVVNSVDEGSITFRKQNGEMQRVTRTAAEDVFANWEAYKQGQVERAELARSNFSTSYLFGVLHALEQHY